MIVNYMYLGFGILIVDDTSNLNISTSTQGNQFQKNNPENNLQIN